MSDEELQTFKNAWFQNPSWWFSKTEEIDNIIRNNYESLLSISCENCDTLTSVLIYDQIPRHIYRNEMASHIIEYFLQKALIVITPLLHGAHTSKLSSIEWTFFMLPLRHTKNVDNIKKVIGLTWERILETSACDADVQVYKRFLKATYSRFLIDCRDQSLIECYTSNSEDIDITSYRQILSNAPTSYNKVSSLTDMISFNTTIFNKAKTIIISLSGGVDSMVCSYLIKYHFPTANVIAVHVNYDNREQCDKEAVFLKHWCSHLNISLYVRKIDEIHRAPCMEYELRDLYESYTRNVRYQSYKSVSNDVLPQIVMGHNKDDCLENIITNMAHKNKYDNLHGMLPKALQDDIEFLRPLLDTTKEDIIKFAKSNNIPFLPNSTPTWSQRGQIRNDIVPCLEKWDKNFISSLFALSNTMASLSRVLQSSVEQFIKKGFMDENKRQFTIYNISVNDLMEEEMFWKEVFIKTFTIYPSSKSIENTLSSIKKFKGSFNKLQLGEGRKVMVTKEVVLELSKIDHTNVCLKVTIKA
jgi:tRNA(Ile)-lysidine synthetase-like protein